jgi:surface antigen
MMQLKAIKCGLLAMLLLCSASAAIAQNSLFLRDSPLASLAGVELDALLIDLNSALDTAEIDTPVTWQTADGRLTSVWAVTEDYQKRGLSCRKMALETTNNGETFATSYGFCQVDGSWLFDLE